MIVSNSSPLINLSARKGKEMIDSANNSDPIKFDINKTVKYWLEGAVYDLETGKSLILTKRYPYALFFGHLALEKRLRRYFRG